jgi:hypothetical protein
MIIMDLLSTNFLPLDVFNKIINFNIYHGHGYDRLEHMHLRIMSLVSKEIRYNIAVYANKIGIQGERKFNIDELIFAIHIDSFNFPSEQIEEHSSNLNVKSDQTNLEFLDIVSINNSASKNNGSISNLVVNVDQLERSYIIIKNGYTVDLFICEVYGGACHLEKTQKLIMCIYQYNRKYNTSTKMRKYFINGAKISLYCTYADVEHLIRLLDSYDDSMNKNLSNIIIDSYTKFTDAYALMIKSMYDKIYI